MQSLVDYFETFPSSHRTLLLVAGLMVFWLLEGAVPLFAFDYRRASHAALNLTLTFLQLLLAVTVGVLIVKAADFTTENRWGLLQLGTASAALQVMGGILMLDFFGGYAIHYLQHKFSWLWRFHIVHHADTTVDVTTGLRHHPIETLFRLSAQLSAVLLGGIPIGVVFMYQILSVFFAQLTHANLQVHSGIDRAFSWVFVTPNMHKVHHHFEKPLTDTNYGNVFSIWDRLFGTFAEVPPQQLQYGIDSLPSPRDHSQLFRLLLVPFRRSAGGAPSSHDEESENSSAGKP